MPNPDLILFSRTPIIGQIKTRLQAVYSPEQTLLLSKFMIEQTVKLATRCWPGKIYLYAWPNTRHSFFISLAEQYDIQLKQQTHGNLGKKMHQALAERINQTGSAAVIGCDVPHCPDEILQSAAECLQNERHVIGPTRDGGYYLIGLNKDEPQLFENIDWGSKHVWQQTLAQIKRLGLEFDLLPRLRDIDQPDDLRDISITYEPLRAILNVLS